MHITIMGTGGIGGYFGARLANAGCDLTFVARGAQLAALRAQGLAFCDQLPATMTSSMHNDLERGGRLEVAWLSGDVVARGQRLGISTPCNRAIFDIWSVHSDGQPK